MTLDPRETPHRELLGDGLLMRTAADERDVERVAALNGSIHGPGISPMTRNLVLHYPGMTGKDLVFVENEHTGEVISSLCLIPWTLSYDEVALQAGEMGLVGTQQAYRCRGLIRAQVGYFNRRLRERGCLISPIAGIGYFYRQFGYEYALPLEGGLRLTARDLPPASDSRFVFRAATPGDIGTLVQLYKDAARDLVIHAGRNADTWRYLLLHTSGTEMEAETLLIEDQNGATVGYVRLPAHHFGDDLTVSEAARLSYDAGLATLHLAATLAKERNMPGVRLNLPAGCTLMRLARSFGARDLGTYAWQIQVPDLPALLRAIGPALERRIAASPFVGLTREVRFCFFRDSVALRFAGGHLAEVTPGGPIEGEISFPPLAFIPLLLGHRSLDELRAAYPDIYVDKSCRMLLETLFLKAPAFLYPAY
jgi:predicted N-acetyltransferase YhbS